MKVAQISDPAEWDQLEPVWNQLLARSAAGTTFLTWEWLRAWWTAYGNAADLLILTASDQHGVLRGIAPFRRETVSRYGRTFATLAFIGDGSNDSDYLDFIVERGFEDAVVQAWMRHLDANRDGALLQLNEIPAASPTLRALQRAASGKVWAEQSVPCATVALPTDWNTYLASLRPRFRTKIRSVLRHLEGQPSVQFGWCESEDELERLLPALFDLHTRRWNADGGPGVFQWDRKRQFYGGLSPRLLDRGVLRMSWLEWSGRLLAIQYGFVYGETYLHLQEGYEPLSEHWNIGLGLRAWTIREFLRAGIREYDFLAGVGRHKMDWGAGVKESRRLVVATRTYRNLLFCRGPEWQERAKDTARKVLPRQVLALRMRRAKQPSNTVGDTLRQAAATCYFHLGGQTASRLIRARYHGSVSADGRLVRGSWTRRTEPSARILYYHRVNDDRDPFFPSLPVDVFAHQMRHIAHNYKVVSLSAVVDHLNSGSRESVVAITFDDGYRDNYENAFPILETYRLPATIFLTTGNVDSGEPMWFELLARALKTTSREFLDVEVDIPRRFWLRTGEERLRANDELFGLLRKVADDERRQQLQHLLRELAAPVSPERTNKMLTWNQVRHMKGRGIDFGGHTVTHPYLSRLSAERLDWEIGECKRRIENETQAAVVNFAYPNGREEDFSPANKDRLRAVGYRAAVTTLWGMNNRTTDPFELRRGGAWEQDDALFAYKMDWYQLVNG